MLRDVAKRLEMGHLYKTGCGAFVECSIQYPWYSLNILRKR